VFFILLCVPKVVPWGRNGPSPRDRVEPVAACFAPPRRRRRLCATIEPSRLLCKCRCLPQRALSLACCLSLFPSVPVPCAAELWLAAVFRCRHMHEPMHTHVHALAHVMPRRRWASSPRRCASPVFRGAGRGLASRPDARTRARPNHRWAGRSRPRSSVWKTASPPRGAPPLSTPAALSCHPSVVARRRVRLFEAARPHAFTCTHSLTSELPR
jgi:hypothetical protein